MTYEVRPVDANSILIKLGDIIRDTPVPQELYEDGILGGLDRAFGVVEREATLDVTNVTRCKNCFANGCCSIQIDLDMGDNGYCSKGRRE